MQALADNSGEDDDKAEYKAAKRDYIRHKSEEHLKEKSESSEEGSHSAENIRNADAEDEKSEDSNEEAEAGPGATNFIKESDIAKAIYDAEEE